MIMNASVQYLPYSKTRSYGLVHSKSGEATPRMCLRMFSRYLSISPDSILDLGCGTGRDLDALSRICPDCWGVDRLPEMIESARSQRPHLHWRVGDMRSVRLGRTFDVIMCMGSGFMYARSNEDVAEILETFVAHAHTGTLLILDVLNAANLPGGRKFRERTGSGASSPQFSATAIPTLSLDRRRQLLARRRKWNISGRPPVVDSCQYRSFFSHELKHLLTERGFRVVGMFDNMELKGTDLSGLKLYVGSIMSL